MATQDFFQRSTSTIVRRHFRYHQTPNPDSQSNAEPLLRVERSSVSGRKGLRSCKKREENKKPINGAKQIEGSNTKHEKRCQHQQNVLLRNDVTTLIRAEHRRCQKAATKLLSCLAGVLTRSIRNVKMKSSSLSNRKMRLKPSSASASCTRTRREKSSLKIMAEVDLDDDTCVVDDIDEVREEKIESCSSWFKTELFPAKRVEAPWLRRMPDASNFKFIFNVRKFKNMLLSLVSSSSLDQQQSQIVFYYLVFCIEDHIGKRE